MIFILIISLLLLSGANGARLQSPQDDPHADVNPFAEQTTMSSEENCQESGSSSCRDGVVMRVHLLSTSSGLASNTNYTTIPVTIPGSNCSLLLPSLEINSTAPAPAPEVKTMARRVQHLEKIKNRKNIKIQNLQKKNAQLQKRMKLSNKLHRILSSKAMRSDLKKLCRQQKFFGKVKPGGKKVVKGKLKQKK